MVTPQPHRTRLWGSEKLSIGLPWLMSPRHNSENKQKARRGGGLQSGGVAEVGLIWSGVGRGGRTDGGFGSGEVPTEREWEEDVEPAEPVGLVSRGELACEQYRRRRTSPDLHTFYTPLIIVLPNKNKPLLALLWVFFFFFTQCRIFLLIRCRKVTGDNFSPFISSHFFRPLGG